MTPVLCYHDSDLIVGVYSEWGMPDSPFCHIMRMLIMHVLPHGEVRDAAPRETASIDVPVRVRASGADRRHKTMRIFCLANKILKASKFIAGSSFSEPGNEDSH